MSLALKSTSSSSNKVEYTDAEIKLAAQALSCCLKLAEQEVKNEIEINQKVIDLAMELNDSGIHTEVATLARDIFRTHIRNEHMVNKTFNATKEFPKMRDPTSVQLIMRKGLEKLGRGDLKDTIFATYGKKVTA